MANTGIHARFTLRYSGFALDVDLALPGRGVTAIFVVSRTIARLQPVRRVRRRRRSGKAAWVMRRA